MVARWHVYTRWQPPSERTRVQAARLATQAAVRARLWQSAAEHRAPALAAAAAVLRVVHAVGNNTKTAIMTSLLLFKVCSVDGLCCTNVPPRRRSGKDISLQSPGQQRRVLVVQVLEWWFTEGEEELAEAQRRVPPPPPAYPPHPGGVDLPDNPSVCPLCHGKRIAPAQLAASGYVFCYKCIFDAVAQGGCCPVTRIRASLNDVRRLFLAA